jgi:hypothetical protein
MSTFDYVLAVTDSSSTVTLTSSPFQVRAYHPLTAPRDEPTLAETLEVRLTDGSVPANLDELRTLQNLLRQAGDAQDNRTLNKVYLNWKRTLQPQPTGPRSSGAGEWQAEVGLRSLGR